MLNCKEFYFKERLKRDQKFKIATNQTEIIEQFNTMKLNDQFATNRTLPRIAFLLTVYQKTDRQIFRLIKTIYDPYHFYYIHVDQVY